MPTYRTPGGFVHIKMTNTKKRPAPAPCVAVVQASSILPEYAGSGRTMRCCCISFFLCDWRVEGGTCDAPLCSEHAIEVGKDRHLCPIHAARHRAAEAELF